MEKINSKTDPKHLGKTIKSFVHFCYCVDAVAKNTDKSKSVKLSKIKVPGKDSELKLKPGFIFFLKIVLGFQ